MTEFCIFEIPYYVVEMSLSDLKTHYQEDKENFTLYNFKTGKTRTLNPQLKTQPQYMDIFNIRCEYLTRHIDNLMYLGYDILEDVIDTNGYIRIKTRTNYLDKKLDKLKAEVELTEDKKYLKEYYSLVFLALDEAQILEVI